MIERGHMVFTKKTLDFHIFNDGELMGEYPDY